jgi:hypothetical protein
VSSFDTRKKAVAKAFQKKMARQVSKQVFPKVAAGFGSKTCSTKEAKQPFVVKPGMAA